MSESIQAPEIRGRILKNMAHTFFLGTLANSLDGELTGLRASRLGHPRSGEAWESLYPISVLPRKAMELAGLCVTWVESQNGATLEVVYTRCLLRATAPGERTDPEAFGYALAMEIMGTGVAWADDHADHELRLPLVEVSVDLVQEVQVGLLELEDEFKLVTQGRFHMSWSSRDLDDLKSYAQE